MQYKFKQYIKLPLKSCSNSSFETDTDSRSMFWGICLLTKWQVVEHSCITDTAFNTDEDNVVNIVWLSSRSGQSTSFMILSPRGDVINCRPLKMHTLHPLLLLQQASKSPYSIWSQNLIHDVKWFTTNVFAVTCSVWTEDSITKSPTCTSDPFCPTTPRNSRIKSSRSIWSQ